MTGDPLVGPLAPALAAPPAVRVERDGDVLICTFNRPALLNAVDSNLLSGWLAALQEAADDDSVGAMITHGEGDGWCVGVDIDVAGRHLSSLTLPRLGSLAGELLGRDQPAVPPPAAKLIDASTFDSLGLNSLAYAMHRFEKPLIAAVNGMAVGGGMAWALLHDVRIASEQAHLSTSFSKLGLVSELGLMRLLVAQAGLGTALDLCLSGRRVQAEEAHQLGLFQYVVGHDDVLERSLSYAHNLATMPRTSARQIRRLACDASVGTFEEYLRHEWHVQSAAFDTPAAAQRFQQLTDRLKP